MPTKYQSDKGEVSPVETAEHKFPVYFCEGCGAIHAAFGVARADGRLSYCGWENGRPVCVDKGAAVESTNTAASPAPW